MMGLTSVLNISLLPMKRSHGFSEGFNGVFISCLYVVRCTIDCIRNFHGILLNKVLLFILDSKIESTLAKRVGKRL